MTRYDYSGRTALITGGAGGIGSATAAAFAATGANVVVADVAASGAEVARGIVAAGGRAEFVCCDVTSTAEVAALVERTVSTFGALDFAFNNAGIEEEHARLGDSDEALFDRMMAINVKGVWACMRAQLRVMAAQKHGVIVNTASVAGLVGAPKHAIYAATKHAVVGLTKSAALEYATRNIRVNAVCPGLIWTPMVEQMVASGQKEALDGMVGAVPMRRHGHADEIANAVLWLCSSASSYVTGQSISVDGGLTMR